MRGQGFLLIELCIGLMILLSIVSMVVFHRAMIGDRYAALSKRLQLIDNVYNYCMSNAEHVWPTMSDEVTIERSSCSHTPYTLIYLCSKDKERPFGFTALIGNKELL